MQWNNCYDDSWKGLISPEAFSHPAKFSRGLIQRIYQYCLEKQYFLPGQTIIDPFGGIGLGAIATHYGLNWLGNELEPRFCQMAWSWDCPGLLQEKYDGYKSQCESPQDWYKLDLGICSECVYKAIDGEQPQPSLFEKVGYFTSPHRYYGNLERFEKFAKDGTWAKLTQGDSRKLNEAWSNEDGLVSSPPYVNSIDSKTSGIDWEKTTTPDRAKYSSKKTSEVSFLKYGSSEGQLGSMPEGLVSSSPFAGNTGGKGKASRDGIDPALFDRHSGGMVGGMHGTEGNLEGMQPGGLVSSSPFSDQNAVNDPKYQKDRTSPGGPLYGEYGDSEGQLGVMGEGLVSSSPYENSLKGSGSDVTRDRINKGNYEGQRQDVWTSKGNIAGSTYGDGYSEEKENIGNDSGPTFWAAAREILMQCHLLLQPNSVAVFVTKNYIKSGKEVDFTGNWQQLCISCGFEIVEEIQAMVVKNLGTQLSYDGDDKEIVVERKSFFRRLHEKKRPDLKIDWETVTIFRKL